MRPHVLLLAVWTAGLAGCVHPLPTPPVQTTWVEGRLALQVEARPPQPAQALSADFELSGTADTGALRLLSPLGTLLADARWDPEQGVTLATPQGVRRFDSLPALSQAVFEAELPLLALPDWLAGRPWSGAPSEPADPQTPSAGFLQLGWHLDLRAWPEQGQLVARHLTPPAMTLRARLAH